MCQAIQYWNFVSKVIFAMENDGRLGVEKYQYKEKLHYLEWLYYFIKQVSHKVDLYAIMIIFKLMRKKMRWKFVLRE